METQSELIVKTHNSLEQHIWKKIPANTVRFICSNNQYTIVLYIKYNTKQIKNRYTHSLHIHSNSIHDISAVINIDLITSHHHQDRLQRIDHIQFEQY